jgi:sugar-specific transcriptional regulator TrmB
MRQERYKASVKSLSKLGFTELEAIVYAYLVENSPATPYRVAQDLGKPVANTYKVVEALYQKGAVLIDTTKNRLCQAISPDELLAKLKDSFLDRHQDAEDALAELKPSGKSEQIFSLGGAGQVLDRCQSLIEQAENIILVDAFPALVGALKPWLEAAAARRVKVVLQVYEAVRLEGVETVAFQSAARMLRRWHGQWLIVVVDGAEYLFAYFGDDGRTVHNAIWCASAFLALPQHSNLALAFRASILEELFKKDASREQVEKELARTEEWLVMGNRGYEKLMAEFAGDRSEK